MKVAFHTLGCKVNSYETQAIAEQFIAAGFEIADFSEPADVYIINSCSVTNMGEHKSRQFINRARKLSPNAIIVATGCYAQRAPDELSGLADIVVGNNHKSEICQIVTEKLERKTCDGAEAQTIWEDLTRCKCFEPQKITRLGENVRAYVKIQDGCNRFCSYCIIPYLRGRSRNRDELEILSEINALAANGYKEVVLTGIDISTFANLAGLIEKVSEIEGIERIRLGSLEVSVITEEFVNRCVNTPKFCPQFHLSLQSGSASVLKRMNRHYTPDEYAEAVRLIRKGYGTLTDPGITTDIIVGFPGETEEEFEETMTFAEKINFTQIHVFKYSRRKGTVADKMPGQILEQIKNQRSEKLIALGARLKAGHEAALEGKEVSVLIEDEDGGFTPEYIRIKAAGKPGEIVRVMKIHNPFT